MGLAFWLWIGFWILGWVVVLGIFFAGIPRETKMKECEKNQVKG